MQIRQRQAGEFCGSCEHDQEGFCSLITAHGMRYCNNYERKTEETLPKREVVSVPAAPAVKKQVGHAWREYPVKRKGE